MQGLLLLCTQELLLSVLWDHMGFWEWNPTCRTNALSTVLLLQPLKGLFVCVQLIHFRSQLNSVHYRTWALFEELLITERNRLRTPMSMNTQMHTGILHKHVILSHSSPIPVSSSGPSQNPIMGQMIQLVSSSLL